MTHVQYINCDKWKRIIGLTLWGFATGGIIFCAIDEYTTYFTSFRVVISDYDIHETCYHDYLRDGWRMCHQDQETDWDVMPIAVILSSILFVGNCIGIWIYVNHKYKFIELKCGIKPKDRINDFGIEVQDHNGKLPKTEKVE